MKRAKVIETALAKDGSHGKIWIEMIGSQPVAIEPIPFQWTLRSP